MKTVGEILSQARKSKQIPLEEIARRTKINLNDLKAIEKNDFSQLPPSAFTKGFMQNYAKIVKLDPKVVLAIFRRDYDQDDKGKIVPRSLSEPVKSQRFRFSPNAMSLTVSIVISLIIAIFFIRQVIIFNSAPQITINNPQEDAQVISPVVISGSTHPEATVSVNNKSITIDGNGSFSEEFHFTPGEHTLVITSTSRNDKKRTIQRVIYVNEP